MKNKFLILWLAGIVGTLCVLPYAFAIQHDVLSKIAQPLGIIVLASVAQTAILLGIAIFFGLKLAQRVNLTTIDMSTPLREKLQKITILAVPFGIVISVVIALGDKLFGNYIPQLTLTNGQIAVWKTLMASMYGGIVEEILMRLFLVSIFAWLIGKIFRSADVVNNSVIMWTAIIIASVLFGLGHLPATSSLTQITPVVIARAIALNGIAGLVFGWLYWKKGLEYSIVAHFTTDITLLVIIPILLK